MKYIGMEHKPKQTEITNQYVIDFEICFEHEGKRFNLLAKMHSAAIVSGIAAEFMMTKVTTTLKYYCKKRNLPQELVTPELLGDFSKDFTDFCDEWIKGKGS